MASQTPSTPVKVPSSAANYTAATLDQDLRSQLNSILISDGHVTKIQDHLLHALNAHSSNWPTLVQNHALSLLRSGEVTTFPALLRRVIEDVRQDTALSPNGNIKAVNGASSDEVNGKKAEGTNGNGTTNNGTANANKPSLAVPQPVVEEALKVTRECLEAVCELDDSGAT
ncbi:hypothetical protein VTK26DRAFT_2721 [Humicola hyalothermophila]